MQSSVYNLLIFSCILNLTPYCLKLSQDIYAYVICYVRRMRRPVVCVSRDVGASNHDLLYLLECVER